MSDPKFVPRDYALNPEIFGRASRIEWKPLGGGGRPSAIEMDRAGSAKIQNRFAYLIRTSARQKFGTISAYAAEGGVHHDRLNKMLRGEVLMRFEDLAQAERLLGGVLSAGFPRPTLSLRGKPKPG